MPKSLLLSCIVCCQEVRWSFTACCLLTLHFPQWLFHCQCRHYLIPAAIGWLPLPLSFRSTCIYHNGIMAWLALFFLLFLDAKSCSGKLSVVFFRALGITTSTLMCLINIMEGSQIYLVKIFLCLWYKTDHYFFCLVEDFPVVIISDCWRYFDFLCSVWSIHFLRSPGHFPLTSSFSSAETHSILCPSISIPMVCCILEIFFFLVFSTKSLKFAKGYSGEEAGDGKALTADSRKKHFKF